MCPGASPLIHQGRHTIVSARNDHSALMEIDKCGGRTKWRDAGATALIHIKLQLAHAVISCVGPGWLELGRSVQDAWVPSTLQPSLASEGSSALPLRARRTRKKGELGSFHFGEKHRGVTSRY